MCLQYIFVKPMVSTCFQKLTIFWYLDILQARRGCIVVYMHGSASQLETIGQKKMSKSQTPGSIFDWVPDASGHTH